jgi:hypothetical protein
LGHSEFVQASSQTSGSGGQVSTEVLPMWSEWILSILVNLLVLTLVWATVIAGLIIIVREKVEDDDLARYR